MEKAIEEKLLACFPGAVINLEFEHSTCSTQFNLTLKIASEKFKNLSKLQKHRLVHDALGIDIMKSIHALVIKAEDSS
jgi:stress-induced morphogen